MEQYISSKIITAAESSIPIRKSNQTKKEVPWWKEDIKTLIKERKKCLSKFKRNPTTDNFNLFMKAKYDMRKAIRSSRKQSWKQFCESINSNTLCRIIFNKIRSLNGSSNFKNISSIQINHSIETNPKFIANHLSSIFAKNSSSSNYTQQFRSRPSFNSKIAINTSPNNEIYNNPITLLEFHSALNSCRGSSPGRDNIRYEMIKHLSVDNMKYILHFFNSIWIQQTFPKNWRKAIVIPILKPGKEAMNADNYRPISLTNCLCKVLERIINKSIFYIGKIDVLLTTLPYFIQILWKRSQPKKIR